MPNEKPDLDAICEHCDKEYGDHSARTLRCPAVTHDGPPFQADKHFKDKVIN